MVGVLAAVFSALPPALEAARTAPRTTMQRSTSGEPRAADLALALAGLAGSERRWASLFLTIRGNLLITFAGLFAVLVGAA